MEVTTILREERKSLADDVVNEMRISLTDAEKRSRLAGATSVL